VHDRDQEDEDADLPDEDLLARPSLPRRPLSDLLARRRHQDEVEAVMCVAARRTVRGRSGSVAR
jgi:hypothetical protein